MMIQGMDDYNDDGGTDDNDDGEYVYNDFVDYTDEYITVVYNFYIIYIGIS